MNLMNQRFDPEAEEDYWRKHYHERPYVEQAGYEDFGPAYAYGVSMYVVHGSRDFARAEPDLERGWDRARGSSKLTWERAKHAVRDVWDRLIHLSGSTSDVSRPVHDTGVRT